MKTNVLLLLAFLAPFLALADGRKGTYIWPEYKKIQVPDSLSGESAFFIDNVRTIDFTDAFETKLTYFQRIYLNSPAAIEEYGQRELFVTDYGPLAMINARIIKSNGEIRELENEEIKETSIQEKNQYSTDVVRRIQLIYPDLEVGDVLDLAYRVEVKFYIYSDLIYLEDELPSLHSRITLRNYSLLDLTAYTLNKMPKPSQKQEGGYPVLYWDKAGVSAINLDYYNALPPEAESAVFVLWKRGENLDFSAYYFYDQYEYSIQFGFGRELTNHLVDAGVITGSEGAMAGLLKYVDYITTTYRWDPEAEYGIKKLMDATADQVINENLFIRYVSRFLLENKVRFEHGFTKSLLNGRFVHGLVSLEQMDARYLLVYDDQNQVHFFFPPHGENCFYFMDEIPAYLEGNQSVALFGDHDGLKETGTVNLPQSDEKSNTHFANVLLAVSGSEQIKVDVKRKDVFKGVYSYLTRACRKKDQLAEYNVAPDSVDLAPTKVDAYYPYAVEYNQEKNDSACFEMIEPGLWWFKSDHFFPKSVYQEADLDEEYDNYVVLPFLKTSTVSIFLQADEALTIQDEQKSLIHESAIGTIKLTANQMMDNVVKIQFEVVVKKRFLENRQEVEAFEEFLRQYVDFRAKKWVLKKGAG